MIWNVEIAENVEIANRIRHLHIATRITHA
jgi:hypothetical protein